MVLAALFAPWIAPHDPWDLTSLNLRDADLPPLSVSSSSGAQFLLGTDKQGRDLLSAILYGSRTSLFVGILAVAFALLLGVSLGLIAGYRGGSLDALIMRAGEVQLSVPSLLLAIFIFAIARASLPSHLQGAAAVWLLIVAIGLSDWVQYARVVRAVVLVEKEKAYAQAARLLGVRPAKIMVGHILPAAAAPILIISAISLPLAIIAEATLSFLGAGMPPDEPSLGRIIRDGLSQMFSKEWWPLLFPACYLVVLTLSGNLLADWLRNAIGRE